MQTTERHSKLPWWFQPAMTYASTVCAVWGYNMAACGGLGAGVLWTFATFGLLVFVRPDVLVAVLLLFALSAGAGLALSAHRLFRGRKELLFFLLPVASVLIGIAVAASGDVHIKCSLGAWR
jgi:hypothetical protein